MMKLSAVSFQLFLGMRLRMNYQVFKVTQSMQFLEADG